jgi:WD40 repeat protein
LGQVTFQTLVLESWPAVTRLLWSSHAIPVIWAWSWAPNSLYVASGGLDTKIILWSVEAPDKHCILRGAHDQAQITGIAWLDNSSLVTAGQDSNTKVWNVTWPN